MSVQYDPARARFVVRWREDGKQRGRRFATEAEAKAFDARVNPAGRAAQRMKLSRASVVARVTRIDAERDAQVRRDGVYPYATNAGVRWRFVYRQSDGTLSTRRGFTSRTAASTARRKLLESIDRGEVKVCRETFETFWNRFAAERRPYMTAGSHIDLCAHGCRRLVPFFGSDPLSKIDEDRVREWLGVMVERVEAGELRPKTVNNARTCLSVALNEACRRGLIPRNPCAAVPALPIDRHELDYLRLDEIGPYVDACIAHYQPLAAFLIGTGARISEALAIQFHHIALDQGVVSIYRQRGREGGDSQPTKGKRFRSVQIGPGLVQTLADLQRRRAASPADWVFICPSPRRGRYANRTTVGPPNRRTVHDWHEAALVDAGLRDMPLHALRHTAAAAWLATGHPLIFVQRQLGHRSITTTEQHYGHLELSFVREAVARTEKTIDNASRRMPA